MDARSRTGRSVFVGAARTDGRDATRTVLAGRGEIRVRFGRGGASGGRSQRRPPWCTQVLLPEEKAYAEPNAAPAPAQEEKPAIRRGTHLAPPRQGSTEAEYNVHERPFTEEAPGRTLGDRASFWRWVVL